MERSDSDNLPVVALYLNAVRVGCDRAEAEASDNSLFSACFLLILSRGCDILGFKFQPSGYSKIFLVFVFT